MSVVSVWVGAVTESSALVKAKVTGSSTRLAVSTDPAMSSPRHFGTVIPDAQGMVTLTASGLDANTRHYYAVEVDGVLDTAFPGQFRTHPPVGKPASFTFAASSCAGGTATTNGVAGSLLPSKVSNAPVFDAIRDVSPTPLFFAHLGDMHYYNPGVDSGNTATDYRRAWNDVLLQPTQHQLYRTVPLVYVWDDHDYGPNNSDGTNPGKAAAQQVYREKVPCYTLPSVTGGVYHSFQIGRVLFIASDSRSYRSPDSDPDGPAKTLLGAEQKTWMRNVLTASDAAVFVWLDQTPWHHTPTDTWAGFATERLELAAMFAELGWSDRMIMLFGDTHAMGMDSGVSNPYGGFPMYLCGSLDSGYGGDTAPYDIGFSAARQQYVVFTVTDDGDTITIAAQGYQSSTVVMSQSVRFPTASSPVARASSRGLQWVAAELTTGRIITDLPSFEADYPLRSVISDYSPGRGTLHLARAPENWERAIEEGNAILACYDDSYEPDSIVWAGYVTSSDRDAFSDEVPVTLATFEALLDRAYVGDATYTTADHRDDIVADVVQTWFINGMGINYLLLDYTPGGGPTPPLMDDPPVANAAIIMQNTDNATVKQRMDQAFAQLGGEYAIDWAFSSDNQFLVPTLRFGTRIGRAAPAGLDPAVTFEDRVLTVFRQRRDYSAGSGANKVVAYSSGQGSTSPFADPVFGPEDGRPVFEYRYQPAPSISPAALATYAQQAVVVLAPGARSITLTATLARTSGRRYGVDWRLGDDLGYQVGSDGNYPRAFPRGLAGVGRAIGVELTDTTISPILYEPTVEETA